MTRYTKSMREALEEVWANDVAIEEGKMKTIATLFDQGKSAEEIAKKMKLPLSTIKTILGETDIKEDTLNEFTDAQIAKLKKEYMPLKGARISMAKANQLRNIFDKIPDHALPKLFKADIPFISAMSVSRMIQKKIPVPKGVKLSAFEQKSWEQVQEETLEEFTSQQIKMAYGIANDKRYKGGNMTGAVSAIEKIAKGLSKHPDVEKVLKVTNEDLKEFKKMKVTIRDMDKRKQAITDLQKQNLGVSVTGGVIKVDGKGRDLNNFAKDLMNFYGANVVAEENDIEEAIDEMTNYAVFDMSYNSKILTIQKNLQKARDYKKDYEKMAKDHPLLKNIKLKIAALTRDASNKFSQPYSYTNKTLTSNMIAKNSSGRPVVEEYEELKEYKEYLEYMCKNSGQARTIANMFKGKTGGGEVTASGSEVRIDSAKDVENIHKQVMAKYGDDVRVMTAEGLVEGKGTIKGFRDDKEKSNMVSLAKQHGLKVSDVPGGIELSGNMRKILDMQLATRSHLKTEEKEEDMTKPTQLKSFKDMKDEKVEKKPKVDVEALKDQIQMLKTKLENEKNKAIKPEPNSETGEVPLSVGLAQKILRDKQEKEKTKMKEGFASDAQRKAAFANGYKEKGKDKKEADLSKSQIKMVHKKADDLPKKSFKDRYGKDGDSVRYATATNIIKKKEKIEMVNHPAKMKYEQISALKKKSDKSGMPYSILKKVFDRGMAAWKGGHRPGASQHQWAFARVNSFITKSSGTWGGADKDLAAKVKGK